VDRWRLVVLTEFNGVTWTAADQYRRLGAAGWTAKKIEHRVARVRDRLSRAGVRDLTREEVGEPVGNCLNDNLLKELVRSMTLVPEHLAVLSGAILGVGASGINC
jgi:hypothetical protein